MRQTAPSFDKSDEQEIILNKWQFNLGTHSKKINYGFSEHGPISFYPPSSYGFSEQNYSENLWNF